MKTTMTLGLALTLTQACWADGTPWLAEPGNTQLIIAQVQQSADDIYKNRDSKPLQDVTPLSELVQDTTWLGVNYALDYDLALDFKTGYARNKEETGLTDSSVGLSWRLVDEFISYSNVPSTVLRAAVILQGDYQTGSPSALGDGADGLELSLIMGRFITPGLALSSEIGYRKRNSGVADDAFYKLAGYVLASPQLSLSLGYSHTNALEGINIGDAGFSDGDVTNFHKLEEDVELVDLGFSYNLLPKLNLGFNAARVIAGKNTTQSDVYALTMDYTL